MAEARRRWSELQSCCLQPMDDGQMEDDPDCKCRAQQAECASHSKHAPDKGLCSADAIKAAIKSSQPCQ